MRENFALCVQSKTIIQKSFLPWTMTQKFTGIGLRFDIHRRIFVKNPVADINLIFDFNMANPPKNSSKESKDSTLQLPRIAVR